MTRIALATLIFGILAGTMTGAAQTTETQPQTVNSGPALSPSAAEPVVTDTASLPPVAPVSPVVCGDSVQSTDLKPLKTIGDNPDDPAAVWYDDALKRVYIKGLFCLERGVLEFVIVGDAGKTHESVIQARSAPIDIAYALLVCGFPYSVSFRSVLGDDGTEYRQFYGQAVDIFIEYAQDGVTKRKPARTFIENAKTNALMTDIPWIFTGSRYITDPGTGNRYFLANIERNIAAVFFDPASLLNTPLNTGYDDTYYRIKEDAIPPKGTPALVIFQPSAWNADPQRLNRFTKDELRDDGGSTIVTEAESPFIDVDAPPAAPVKRQEVQRRTDDHELDQLMNELEGQDD